jgi:hypothetical protein
VAYIERAFTLMRESAGSAALDQVAEAGALLEQLGLVVSRSRPAWRLPLRTCSRAS